MTARIRRIERIWATGVDVAFVNLVSSLQSTSMILSGNSLLYLSESLHRNRSYGQKGHMIDRNRRTVGFVDVV